MALLSGGAVVFLDPLEPVGEFFIAVGFGILDTGLQLPRVVQRGFNSPNEVIVLVFDWAPSGLVRHRIHLLGSA